MPIISLIAAIDAQNGLGKNNQLLCHLPADLKRFKELTLGKPIIMGRKTFYSIGHPLPGRENIVVTGQDLIIPQVRIAANLPQALDMIKNQEEAMIIGGAALFADSLLFAQNLYLTRIHHQFEADVYFPTVNMADWVCIKAENRPRDEKNPFDLTFYHYQRKYL